MGTVQLVMQVASALLVVYGGVLCFGFRLGLSAATHAASHAAGARGIRLMSELYAARAQAARS